MIKYGSIVRVVREIEDPQAIYQIRNNLAGVYILYRYVPIQNSVNYCKRCKRNLIPPPSVGICGFFLCLKNIRIVRGRILYCLGGGGGFLLLRWSRAEPRFHRIRHFIHFTDFTINPFHRIHHFINFTNFTINPFQGEPNYQLHFSSLFRFHTLSNDQTYSNMIHIFITMLVL